MIEVAIKYSPAMSNPFSRLSDSGFAKRYPIKPKISGKRRKISPRLFSKGSTVIAISPFSCTSAVWSAASIS